MITAKSDVSSNLFLYLLNSLKNKWNGVGSENRVQPEDGPSARPLISSSSVVDVHHMHLSANDAFYHCSATPNTIYLTISIYAVIL